MTNRTLTPADLANRSDINWSRKPTNFYEIDTTWVDSIESLGAKFTDKFTLQACCLDAEVPSELRNRPFLCKGANGATYLVDASGYDYARYATEIKVNA